MQHVAAREDARHAGLEAFVDNGPFVTRESGAPAPG